MGLVRREEKVAFLNITPNAETKSWAVVGQGIVALTVAYNPQKETEHYIIHKNASTSLNAYQLSIDTEQKAYYGDDCYDFIDDIRYNLKTGADAETEILLIDKYKSVNGAFQAQVFKCTISVNTDGGDAGQGARIGYTIDLNGDPDNGTATFTGNVPTFTKNISA